MSADERESKNTSLAAGARRRRRVVVVGAGFAGLSVARTLAHRDVEVTIIDRQNHHLFQPLLYQVATAELSPGDIAWPIRRVLRRADNIRVIMGEVDGIDTDDAQVVVDGKPVSYDYLVLATGVSHDYFGNDGWASSAPGLKTIDDATRIRRRVLVALERAETATDAAEVERLLSFVVVGAGPTGVELAGALAELTRDAMRRDFRRIEPARARILLVEAGDYVLPSFDPALRDYAERALERLGVDVRLGQPITQATPQGVVIGKEVVGAANILWAAGVKASGPAQWLNTECDRAGRVLVNERLSLAKRDNIFVIGDCAAVQNPDGSSVPGIAPAAKQQGVYIGKRLLALLDRKDVAPFKYKDAGSLATIGRNHAVADFGWIRLRGRLAWWLWGIAHIYFLIGARNRVLVATQWLWAYLTSGRAVRLITGVDTPRRE